MNSNPRFGFIFTVLPMDGLADIYEFDDATWNASGYGYGEILKLFLFSSGGKPEIVESLNLFIAPDSER